jgi:hypothetical protein
MKSLARLIRLGRPRFQTSITARARALLDDYAHIDRDDVVVVLSCPQDAQRAAWIAATLSVRKQPRRTSLVSLGAGWQEELSLAARAASESDGQLALICVDRRLARAELREALLRSNSNPLVSVRSVGRFALLFLGGMRLAAGEAFPLCGDL